MINRRCSWWLVLGCVCCLNAAHAQVNMREKNIQTFPDHFFIWPVLKQRSLDFSVKSRNAGKSVRYQPNNSFNVGLGAYVFDVSVELTFAIPLNEKSHRIFGESRSRDFQLNTIGRKWGLDLFHQKYRGFYTDNDRLVIDDEPYFQRPDIATRNLGVTVLYVFSEDRFSTKSAFNFAERQLESGGSWIVTGTINSFKLDADRPVLDTLGRAGFGTGSTFTELKHTTFSIAPGYGYNFIQGNFFISGALMAGPAHNWLYYSGENVRPTYDIRFNTFASFRLGLGYNTDNFFAGVNFVQQSRVVKFEDIQFTNSTSTFRFVVGWRFRKVGVLEKSFWDLPRDLANL